MKLQLICIATLRLEYAGYLIFIAPLLAAKEIIRSFVVYFESLEHGTITCPALPALADIKDISASRLHIPDDGEKIKFY